MLNLNTSRAKEIIGNCNGKIIAVIGDVMLDRYFWGTVSRVSPEAPVPIVDIDRESCHLGGASNVAHNLKSLGINVLLCGIIGDDSSGKTFIQIANESGINSKGLYIDNERPTTVKTRVIGNNQQIARLDREIREPVSSDGEKYIFNTLLKEENLSAIIFEDYNKGTITESLISTVIKFAGEKNIPIFVDPKFDNFFNYKKVTVFKPNRKEARQALGLPMKSLSDLENAGKILMERLDCENVLLTLGADGMMLFEKGGSISKVPTLARHVADVSGAGDTAIATLAAAFTGGATVKEAASMANYAAGVVCEEPGIVSITVDNLLKAITYNSGK